MQIYTAFDIGSGKPTPAERARAPHHLVDIADPLEPIEAQRFADLATAALLDVRARGKLPIVCGGTFLWVKALVWGRPCPLPTPRSAPITSASPKPRAAPPSTPGSPRSIPASAARLAPNDFVVSVAPSRSTRSRGAR